MLTESNFCEESMAKNSWIILSDMPQILKITPPPILKKV